MTDTRQHFLKKIPGFIFAIWLSFVLGPHAQEPSGKEKKSDQQGKPDSQKPSEGAQKKDQEEYYEIKTPFGIQRIKKTPGTNPAQPQPAQTSPLPATTPAPLPAAPARPPGAESPAETQPAPGATGPAAPAQQNPPASSPQTQPAQVPSRGPAPVKLRLDHADLLQVINIICNDLLKINYVVDPKVKGVVTVNTAGEFKREDLFPLLETLLRINGAALVKTGNIYQIVPSPEAKTLPLPIRKEGEPADPNALSMQIVPMQVILAADMAKILTSYLSEDGNIVVHETGNILIITESDNNLKRLLQLINIFDTEVFQNQRVRLYPIKNNSSRNLLPDLESVFMGYALSSKGSAVRFISIDRINSILAVSANPKSFVEVEKWIEKLDKPAGNVGVRNYFYKVENAEAKNIATLLLQIYGRRSEEEKISPAQSTASGASPALPMTAPPGAPEGAKGPSEKKGPLAGIIQSDINVVADEINNALIIRASPQDYEIIKETIKELDLVPRQVLIDAKIYEVNLNGELSMGVAAFLQNRSNPAVAAPPGTEASFSASKAGNLSPGLNISTFTVIGKTRELVAFLNAQESRNRTRVLSSPSVIASDNKDAKIQVGADVPILTSQGLVPGGQVGGTSPFLNTIQNRSTGVILNVTPRINSSGWVTLKISEEVSSPQAPAAGSVIQSPSISIRSVNTQVTVKDGETIAIGGIISENKLLSKNRVPLLGDIPGLGLIFGTTSYTNARTELIALITPHVIQDIEAASDITDELKTQLKALKKDLRKLDHSN